jgi:hypothetical protein
MLLPYNDDHQVDTSTHWIAFSSLLFQKLGYNQFQLLSNVKISWNQYMRMLKYNITYKLFKTDFTN